MSGTSSTTGASAQLGTIRIEIGGANSKPYKSIDGLVWDGIPPFAVLTGLNGSGKTQLLELLAYKLTDTNNPHTGAGLRETRVAVTGATYTAEDVVFLPSSADVGQAPVLGLAQMQQTKNSLWQQLQAHNVANNMAMKAMRARLQKQFGVSSLEQLGQEEFNKRLPDDFAFMLEEIDVVSGLTHVFIAYRLRAMEELERGTRQVDVPTKLGPTPWDVLNEAFKVAEFPYRVRSPVGTKITDLYQIRLEDVESGASINTNELSSGEKALFRLVLWMYNSQHHGRFPKLFLLDEPDCHLHPSMTRQMLAVLKEVLVAKYGVRVICSTHSPSTVALAPDGSVFEMSRKPPRVTPSKSKENTIGLLTAGLVTVFPGTRYAFVEDADDVTFYNAVRDVLSDYGPSRDQRALAPAPSLVFLPASLGTGPSKIGGGKSVVFQWVEKFDQPPLQEIFRGIVDLDSGNTPMPRVHVLGRYSIENYLLDPFVVFALLLHNGTAPNVPGLTVSRGDEHRIRTMTQVEQDAILNAVRAAVEPELASLAAADTSMKNVTFTNGRVFQYPAWMISRRGHDLLVHYQAVFGGPRVISPPRLVSALHTVRLIPSELAEIMHLLQQ